MITVVTAGSGRCGTSLTMQMLQAAGMPLFWNRLPNRTTINPFGHYEIRGCIKDWNEEFALDIAQQAQGKVVKVFWSGVGFLPADFDYQFIELQRDRQCMMESQLVMLNAEGRTEEANDPSRTVRGIAQGCEGLHAWLSDKRHITLQFSQLFNGEGPALLADFLHLEPISIAKMMECVEPALWHFKPKGE